ncbi:MAG: DUF1538 domain-containing protein [Clostridia bacterium]|nr:DUF1538 domain-containing protein [Clostridia bacterium]
MKTRRTVILEKIKESLSSVLPVAAIVAVLCFSFIPIESGTFLSFLAGTVLLVIGMGLFSLGAETSMEKMGEYVGVQMTRSKKIWLIILLSFLVGVMITVSEPDLSVLAGQVSSVNRYVLIFAVGLGVGVFLVLAMLRILFGIKLSYLLLVSYAIVFVLMFFVPKNFVPLAFDSGGVTTGPMTVPFIMALGVGAASIRSDKNAEADAFGLVALSSVGPILAVMLIGVIAKPSNAEWSMSEEVLQSTTDLSRYFLTSIPHKLGEVAIALFPIVIFFLIYQFIAQPLSKGAIAKILIGALYTYVGLVLFLTGASCGFMQTGYDLGHAIAESKLSFMIVPIGCLVGYFTVKAEPAVILLEKQVEDVTSGAIPRKMLSLSLSLGVAAAVGIAMLRALTGISLLYFLLPLYAIALVLTFVAPDIFTSIAFDSGGVASGPMTATFLLPLAAGVCDGVGGVIMTDAFGIVAMVAVTPLVTIQILGVVYKLRLRKARAVEPADDDVIEL